MLMTMAALIVGVALLTGTDQLEQNSNSAMQNEMRHVIVDLAGRAQAWYHSPVESGGGGRSFDGFTLAKINFDSAGMLGAVSLTNTSANGFRLIGTIHEDANWSFVIDVYPDSYTVVE